MIVSKYDLKKLHREIGCKCPKCRRSGKVRGTRIGPIVLAVHDAGARLQRWVNCPRHGRQFVSCLL